MFVKNFDEKRRKAGERASASPAATKAASQDRIKRNKREERARGIGASPKKEHLLGRAAAYDGTRVPRCARAVDPSLAQKASRRPPPGLWIGYGVPTRTWLGVFSFREEIPCAGKCTGLPLLPPFDRRCIIYF